jgi:hypothetical protein
VFIHGAWVQRTVVDAKKFQDSGKFSEEYLEEFAACFGFYSFAWSDNIRNQHVQYVTLRSREYQLQFNMVLDYEHNLLA